MEISFEKGKFVYCPGGFNYQEVLDDFKRAKKVRIITYNISGTGNTDPLLEQIKKLGEDVDVQIITISHRGLKLIILLLLGKQCGHEPSITSKYILKS